MSIRARGALWAIALFSCAAALSLPLARAQSQPPDALTPGKSIYDRSCATCHGARGRGDGPAAAVLDPAPRDFTRGVFKFRSTNANSLPTDEDLARAVADGLPGTSMPAFKSLLSASQRQSVIDYIKRFSPRFGAEKLVAVSVPAEAAATPESLAAGKQVYEKLSCSTCHGEDGAAREELRDEWGHAVRSTDLTEPWAFRGGSTARDMMLRVKAGIAGSPMPAFEGTATDKELAELAVFVTSLARKPAWQMTADELKALYARQAKQAADNPVERGRYLVESLSCAHCHSPVGSDGVVLPGMKLAGGVRFNIAPFGDFVTYNLTSDKDTGLGNWSDAEIKAVITKGTRPDGTRLLPFPMGWPAYAHLTDADLSALVAFLRTVPPVANKIPPPQPAGIFAFLSGKFRWLILKQDPPMTIFVGNAGSAGPAKTGDNKGN
jgi:mono/diheme cytochrome c family protein